MRVHEELHEDYNIIKLVGVLVPLNFEHFIKQTAM